MTRAAAERLAAQIQDYWHARGYRQVTVWVERGTYSPANRGCVDAIRSNLVAGLPPRIEAERRRRA